MAIPANALYTTAAAITPSDSADISVGPPVPIVTDAIWIGGAGVIAVVFQNGAVVNFTVAANTLLPLKARRVNSTNTTATLMVALYQ